MKYIVFFFNSKDKIIIKNIQVARPPSCRCVYSFTDHISESYCTCHNRVALRDTGGEIRVGTGGKAWLHVFQASVQGWEWVLICLWTNTQQNLRMWARWRTTWQFHIWNVNLHSSRLCHDLVSNTNGAWTPLWELDNIYTLCRSEEAACDPLTVFPLEYSMWTTPAPPHLTRPCSPCFTKNYDVCMH